MNVLRCRYFFYADPHVILLEIPYDKSVMITEHRYTMDGNEHYVNAERFEYRCWIFKKI